MNWVLTGVAVVLLIAVGLILLRAIRGPTTFDRILAVNTMGTKAVILLAVISFVDGRADFLDIALLYALLNFIATVVILKYVEYRRLD